MYRELCLELAQTARKFANQGIPGCDVRNGVEDGHPTATMDLIEKIVGGPLRADEMTVVALSRCFGPAPYLDGKSVSDIGSKLWPNKNPEGRRLSWVELAEKLEGLYPA